MVIINKKGEKTRCNVFTQHRIGHSGLNHTFYIKGKQDLDIATTTSCTMSSTGAVHDTHKDFMVRQLCGVDKAGVPQSRRADHIPVPIVVVKGAGLKAKGRLTCKHCHLEDKKRTTCL